MGSKDEYGCIKVMNINPKQALMIWLSFC